MLAGLVQTDKNFVVPIPALIDFQHVFHRTDELGAALRRDAPALFQPEPAPLQNGGLSSFFERLAHRFSADAVHYLAFNQPVRQQLQRPTSPAFRRFSAGQGNQVGLSLTVQPLRTPVNLPLSSQRRLNPFLHAAPAHPFHRRTANLENPGNVFILHAPVPVGLITQQQSLPPGKWGTRPWVCL